MHLGWLLLCLWLALNGLLLLCKAQELTVPLGWLTLFTGFLILLQNSKMIGRRPQKKIGLQFVAVLLVGSGAFQIINRPELITLQYILQGLFALIAGIILLVEAQQKR